MKKLLLFLIFHSFIFHSLLAQRPWGYWDRWGEQPDGTYLNPVIPADYSDLDCIRVGDDYYAISSTMQFSPGMTILHSRDLVNWEIAGNAVSDLSQISPAMTWQQMDRYGRGIWAGTLRHHKGRFYLYFGTPDEGFFMTSAQQAQGPWEPLTCLLAESGWDDCSVIWDEEGDAWFVGTCFREGYKTYLFRMAPDGRSIDRASARLVNEGYGREANKLIFHDGYYYLIFSEHRDGIGRYVMAKRDRHMRGPFSEERQLLQPCREANEPNQGGIISVPAEFQDSSSKFQDSTLHSSLFTLHSQSYFLTHHGSGDWSGRIVSLLPVTWQDGWPMIGDISNGTPGQMVWQALMPGGTKKEKLSPQRNDDFEVQQLGAQWQWNYQPRTDHYSLTEHPGWLRLRAFPPLENDKLLKAGNTLTQRSFRTPHNEVTTRLDISHMTDGQHAGLCHFAAHSGCLGVVRRDGRTRLELRHDDQSELGPVITSQYLYLRSTWGLDGQSQFSYSLDGTHFTPFSTYHLSWGHYRGDRIGIYNYNNLADSGYVDIDYLHYK
jgi:beta-xylosidase